MLRRWMHGLPPPAFPYTDPNKDDISEIDDPLASPTETPPVATARGFVNMLKSYWRQKFGRHRAQRDEWKYQATTLDDGEDMIDEDTPPRPFKPRLPNPFKPANWRTKYAGQLFSTISVPPSPVVSTLEYPEYAHEVFSAQQFSAVAEAKTAFEEMNRLPVYFVCNGSPQRPTSSEPDENNEPSPNPTVVCHDIDADTMKGGKMIDECLDATLLRPPSWLLKKKNRRLVQQEPQTIEFNAENSYPQHPASPEPDQGPLIACLDPDSIRRRKTAMINAHLHTVLFGTIRR